MAMISFAPDSPECASFLAWWQGLHADKGARARLRRANSLDEAMRDRRVVGLALTLGVNTDERIGLMAVLAAQVPPEDSRPGDHRPRRSPAEAFADPKPGTSREGNSALSDLRFRRLLSMETREELFPQLRRALTLVENNVDVVELARAVWWWNDRTRRDWADAYYRRANLS